MNSSRVESPYHSPQHFRNKESKQAWVAPWIVAGHKRVPGCAATLARGLEQRSDHTTFGLDVFRHQETITFWVSGFS
jgi:hypothetical protein